MERFEEAVVEVIEFEADDIILTSPCGGYDPNDIGSIG